MEYRKLGNTGMEISIVGYGASPLGNVFDETDESEGVRAVHYAIDHGINYFDVFNGRLVRIPNSKHLRDSKMGCDWPDESLGLCS